MPSITTSFAVTPENFQFLKQFPNKSKFLNSLITKNRQESKKEDLLRQYNDFAESDEMNEWLDVANNSVNL